MGHNRFPLEVRPARGGAPPALSGRDGRPAPPAGRGPGGRPDGAGPRAPRGSGSPAGPLKPGGSDPPHAPDACNDVPANCIPAV
ncbi:hypothetical protein SSCG_03330 [Streptomyces clavuligerus]|nr:hypothetical protein SSCG_03330 [Streptomyces clavuligerus]